MNVGAEGYSLKGITGIPSKNTFQNPVKVTKIGDITDEWSNLGGYNSRKLPLNFILRLYTILPNLS